MRTEGIVLRCHDYSETSQTASVLSPTFGQIHLLAKGAHRPRKEQRPPLDALARYDLVIAQRPAGQLQIAAEWTLKEMFGSVSSDVERLWCAFYAAEVALAFATEGPEDGKVFAALLECLRHLDAGAGGPTTLALFLGKALSVFGHAPVVGRCTECGGELRGATRFSPKAGGALCGGCAGADPQAMSISRGALAVMSRLQAQNGHASLRVSQEQAVEIRRAFHEQIQYHLGRPLRVERFIGRWARTTF